MKLTIVAALAPLALCLPSQTPTHPGGPPPRPQSGGGVGQDPAESLPISPTPAPPTLEDLAWLAGAWRGEGRGVEFEEYWMPPKGGMMLGLHRDTRDGQRAKFEYLRIEQREDGSVVYLASPSGKSPTAFALVGSGERSAVFENPEHDFPQRIRYSLEGDVLTALVGDLSGKPGLRWRWRRVEGR